MSPVLFPRNTDNRGLKGKNTKKVLSGIGINSGLLPPVWQNLIDHTKIRSTGLIDHNQRQPNNHLILNRHERSLENEIYFHHDILGKWKERFEQEEHITRKVQICAEILNIFFSQLPEANQIPLSGVGEEHLRSSLSKVYSHISRVAPESLPSTWRISPMKRTVQTFEIGILPHLTGSTDIQEMGELVEHKEGAFCVPGYLRDFCFENQREILEFASKSGMKGAGWEWFESFVPGETDEEFRKRVLDIRSKLLDEGQNIGVTTHAGVIREMIRHTPFIETSSIMSWPPDNGTISTIHQCNSQVKTGVYNLLAEFNPKTTIK